MELGKVYVDAVTVPAGKRPLDERKVSGLAESIAAIGLQQPISVWSPNDETVVLVAGRHRFAAAQKLGWEEIDCIFVQMDEIDRELWEIDENLIRNELTPAEVAEHMARRKQLWAEKQKVGQLAPLSTGRGHRQFAAETAAATGKDKRTINRAVARGEKIAPDVLERIKSNPDLNKGVVLDQLARMSHEEQRETVASGRRPISPPAPPLDEFEAFNKWCGEMNRLWSRAPREWRERWLEQKDRAVFDRTRSGRAA